MQYGLNLENQNMITLLAAGKKDGCYTFRGVYYRVRDGKVTHLAAYGKFYMTDGNFNFAMSTPPGVNPDWRKWTRNPLQNI